MKLDRQMKKIIAGVILGGALAAFTGCSSMIGYGKGDGGHFEMSGDSMGMQAFSDLIVGIQDEATSPPEQKNSYWQSTEMKTQGRIMRFQKPAFMKGGSK